MNSPLRMGVSLTLLALLASCGGGTPAPVLPGAAAPSGSTFVGTAALPGVPSNTVMLLRVHSADSAYSLIHSWSGLGPESLGAVGADLAKAVDFERGAAALVTVDKDANIDKVLAGEQPLPVHAIAVVAVRDLASLRDMSAGAQDVSPGRRRFLNKDDGDLHTKLQCDVQTASIPNTGFVVCGDELAMRDLFAVATTTVMALRPTAQVHLEVHKDNAEPLLSQASNKVKGLAGLVPNGAELLAMHEDSLAMFADMSDMVIDTTLDPSGLRMDFAQVFPRQNSEAVQSYFSEPKNHFARSWFEQQPGETLAASYGENGRFAKLAAMAPMLKRMLESESRKDNILATVVDTFSTAAKRFAGTTQVAFAGGMEGTLIRAFAAKAVAHETDKASPEPTVGEFPGYVSLWHDGDAWLLPSDVSGIKAALNAAAGKKQAGKTSEKRMRGPQVVQLVPAKSLPAELAGGTVIRMADGKPLSPAAQPKKGAPPKKEDVSFFVAEVPFMGGRVLLGGVSLPTLATVLRRTSTAGSKVANLGVFRARADGLERGFMYSRTDLLAPLARMVEAHAKDKNMSMVSSTMSLMDAVEHPPTSEVQELSASVKDKTTRWVVRFPADVFVNVAKIVRSVDKTESVDPDKEL